jgi:hypothetical protein
VTLQECIDRHHAAQRRSIVTLRTTALTPLGVAVVAARRLGRQLAEIDDGADRLFVLTTAGSETLRVLGVQPVVA